MLLAFYCDEPESFDSVQRWSWAREH